MAEDPMRRLLVVAASAAVVLVGVGPASSVQAAHRAITDFGGLGEGVANNQHWQISRSAETGSLGGSEATGDEDELVVETRDWVIRVPTWVRGATQYSVDALATHVQNCTDVVRAWVSHRPRPGLKFVWRYLLTTGAQVGGASPDGVTVWVHADYTLPRLGPECRGPHEVTHVLTSETFGGPPILVEGIAQFSDMLFTPGEDFACDEGGYTWYGERFPYTDIRDWQVEIGHYNTAACLWYEIRARGGDGAIRRVLASARADRPVTTGDLLVHNVNPALGLDLTEVAMRYGFTRSDLTSGTPPRAPAPPSCPAGSSSDGELAVATVQGGLLEGTPGRDFLCGGSGVDRTRAGSGNDWVAGLEGADQLYGDAGNDLLRGDRGPDILSGGAGNDLIFALDGDRDVIDGGPGRDVAMVDSGDVVTNVERVVPTRRGRD